MTDRRRIIRGLAIIAVVFGVVTVISGGATLFGMADMGAVVPFVLWFNTVAGGAYAVSGVGLWRGRSWAQPLAFFIFFATLLVFAAFGLHALRGGGFEMRTVFAMAFRTAFWSGIAFVARGESIRASG